MKVHQRIARIRKEKSISRAALAKSLRTTRRKVWRIEKGQTRLLADDIARYARALKVSPAELVA